MAATELPSIRQQKTIRAGRYAALLQFAIWKLGHDCEMHDSMLSCSHYIYFQDVCVRFSDHAQPEWVVELHGLPAAEVRSKEDFGRVMAWVDGRLGLSLGTVEAKVRELRRASLHRKRSLGKVAVVAW